MHGGSAVPAPHPIRQIVLVGRPNVGKSTLFNRITGTRRAIVTEVPGTTRDVLRAPAEWLGWRFEMVDTGGMFGASEDPLQALVVEHGWRAVASADLIIFLVDGQSGILPPDEEIARELRQIGTPVVVAVNKMDDRRGDDHLLEVHRLGFDATYPISAEHGMGIDDLLDGVRASLSTQPGGISTVQRPDDTDDHADEPRDLVVAVVGRPNVGKSSLVNQLLKEERALVSEMPGTTRDAVEGTLAWRQRRFRIVDTAGIRRPGRVARSNRVEALSVLIAKRSLERADVAVLVIDALEGATDQDAAIAGEADRSGCAVIIAVNKWDLVKGRDEAFMRTFDDRLRQQLKFLDYAPLIHLSARTGERIPRLLEMVDRLGATRLKRIATSELNRFVETLAKAHAPARSGHKNVRILYAVQTAVAPPTFLFFTRGASRFHFSYERFLVNRLRETFGFLGSPIRIHARAR